ncbi:MAG: hypothetical protein ABI742_07435 [Gemmatimonadota bacterium]
MFKDREMLQKLLEFYVPDVGGALWLGLLVAFLLFGDFKRLLAPRNLALLGLLITAPFLNDIERWNYTKHPTIATYLWDVIFLITLGHTIWGFLLAQPRDRPGWVPNVPRSGLAMLCGLLVTMNVLMTLGKKPEDAGFYIALGSQRWLETGVLPYGDSALVGPTTPGFGAAATYGPILYLAHVPTQLLLDGTPNPPDADVMNRAVYQRPSMLGPQLVMIVFHLAGLLALFAVTRRLAGTQAALGAVALYACMPYLAGLDAGRGSIAGLRFISHIAPPALLLLALWAVDRPFLSGALFACAAGALFFPVFIFPAWFAWRYWRNEKPWQFFAGTAVAGAAILAMVIRFTPADSILGSVGKFLHAIVEHQEGVGPHQYGGSNFGFWGTHPGLAFLHHPLAGSPFSEPVFLAFVSLCLAACFLVRRGGVTTLAAITAALGAGVQLWKTHGGGTYIEWYLPFLILALVAGDRTRVADELEGAAVPGPEGARS